MFLVLDGIGDVRSARQPLTPLEQATTPHLDRLAERSALGRLVPVATGITPGSGPGHLALFGYDPTSSEADIGRGVLEALGLNLDVDADTVVARGNFATVDPAGRLVDRRAGRIATAEGQRVCARLRERIVAAGGTFGGGVEVEIHAGEAYRFVLLFRAVPGAAPLEARLADTDPQRLGVSPRSLVPIDGVVQAAAETAERLEPTLTALAAALEGEAKANAFLLRGFSRRPALPNVCELHHLRAAALAGYPLYRGVARVCGMDVLDCGKTVDALIDVLEERWTDYDFFFLHVKGTDMAGEDGDAAAKAEVVQEVDRVLPRLLALHPDVLAITGDHSTPAPMRAHSWHPAPLLLSSEHCFVDDCGRFTETEAIRGAIGTIPANELMGLLLANAGKLAKFGA